MTSSTKCASCGCAWCSVDCPVNGLKARMEGTSSRNIQLLEGVDGSFFDKEGKAISFFEWLMYRDYPEYCRVALDAVGPFEISTVWLGLNHSHREDQPPLIFETMLFTDDAHDECHRWSSLEAAQQGHAQLVEKLKELCSNKTGEEV